mgnify:CR=1 FL=1
MRSLRYLSSPGGHTDDLMRGTRTLILIHGFPLSADMWLPQLARVPLGWRFVAPDVRGFRGAGPAYEDAFLQGATVDDYASDVLELMDHLDLRRAAIGGLSMGGYIAMAVALRAPQRVSHLVLADTKMTADTDEIRTARDATRALVEREGPPAIAAQMLPRLVGETTRREQPDLNDALRHLITMNRTESIVGGITALKARPDRSAALATLTMPTLVICGAEDVMTPPSDSEAIARTIPGAKLVILPRAGHMANMEQPTAFNAALEEFLGARVGTAGA